MFRDVILHRITILVLDRRHGVAETALQAPRQFAGQLQLQSLRMRFNAAVIRLGANVASLFRRIALLYPEHGCRGIQLAIEKLALQAQLVTLAFDRLERGAGNVGLVLRVENLGVTGVGRYIQVQIVDQAGIRRGGTGAGLVADAVGNAGGAGIGIVGAEQQLEIVGQIETRRAIQGLALVGIGTAVNRGIEARLRVTAVECACGCERRTYSLSVMRDIVQCRTRPAGADGQVVLASAQRIFAVDIAVDDGLLVV